MEVWRRTVLGENGLGQIDLTGSVNENTKNLD